MENCLLKNHRQSCTEDVQKMLNMMEVCCLSRHGRGVLTRPDGSSYSGQFEHGVAIGSENLIADSGM